MRFKVGGCNLLFCNGILTLVLGKGQPGVGGEINSSPTFVQAVVHAMRAKVTPSTSRPSMAGGRSAREICLMTVAGCVVATHWCQLFCRRCRLALSSARCSLLHATSACVDA
eukprot:2127881-Amphidinium_carterae.1